MLSIEPISFKSTVVMHSQNNKSPYIKTEPKPQVSSSNGCAIYDTLLAFSLLGMSLVAACSSDDTLKDLSQTQKNETVSVYSSKNKPNASKKNSYEKADEILASLGFLKNDTLSIKNVKVIAFVDNNRVQHWVKFDKNNDEKIISGQGIFITPDWTAGKIYNFYANGAASGGLDVTRNYNDNTKETQNYKLNNDGSVTEYDVLDNNLLIEKSTYKKQDDGKICQTFFNGDEIVYSSIGNFFNDLNYPTPVAFSAYVSDCESVE